METKSKNGVVSTIKKLKELRNILNPEEDLKNPSENKSILKSYKNSKNVSKMNI
jgi:hypothetical protein